MTKNKFRQVDDLIGITEAGFKSHQMNTYLNIKTADKYLQFGHEKCKTMLVSKKKEVPEYLHSKLQVDTWKITFDEQEVMSEVYDGKKGYGGSKRNQIPWCHNIPRW